jgi:peroxiredoxin
MLKKIIKKNKVKILKSGDKLPPFQMTTHTGSSFIYDSKLRSKLLIYFFPNAWSETNEEQILDMENNYTRFVRYNITPVCVTTDSPASLKKWAKMLSLKNVKLLSDFWPHGFLTNSFGLLNRQRGCPERALVAVDDDRTVTMIDRLEHSNSFDVEEIFNHIREQNQE